MSDYADFVSNPDSVWVDPKSIAYMGWDDVHELSAVQKAVESSNEYSRNLPREAFLGLYDSAHELAETPPKGLEIVKNLIGRAQEMPEYQDLQRTVEGDQWACAAGSSTFVHGFLKNLPEDVKNALKEQQDAQDASDQASNQLNALQQMMASGQKGGSGGAGNGPQMNNQALQDAIQKAQDAQNALNSANQNAQNTLDKNQHQINNGLAKSMKSADQTLNDMKDNAKALGWGMDGGHLNQQKIEDLQKMAEILNKTRNLRKVIEMLGWAKQLMKAELKKKVQGHEQLVDYQRRELELDKMAPEEWIGFAAPAGSALNLDWLIRAVDGDILHMKFEGEEPKGKGACVIVKDTSGSMMGNPFATATALEYVIMQQMIKDNRRFCSIPFSGHGSFEVYDPGPKPNLDELLKHMEFGYWGGTEPYAPLTKAIEIISTDPSFKEGYILIITDGSFSAPPQAFLDSVAAARKKPGLKVVAIVVGCDPGAATFADMVITVNDLFNEKDKLSQALGSIV